MDKLAPVDHQIELNGLPVDLRERENADRSRRPQAEFVFAKTWGQPL